MELFGSNCSVREEEPEKLTRSGSVIDYAEEFLHLINLHILYTGGTTARNHSGFLEVLGESSIIPVYLLGKGTIAGS